MDLGAVSFVVAKEDLASAVSWVARNLPTKPAQPVLRAMLITADDDGLEFAGFDYEVSTKVRIPAEVNQPGRIAVAGKLIADITATLPNKPVEIFVDGSTVQLKCGSSRFELPSIPLDDYPTLPTLPEVTGAINPRLFIDAVTQVATAAGKDDTLPMLTGVHMEIEGEDITLTATDRFRLALRRFQWIPAFPDAQAKLLIPAKNFVENARTLDANSTEPVEIAVGSGDSIGAEGLFGIHVDARQTTTRLLDAEFPNVNPLLPKFHKCLASVEISSLQDAIKRVALVADRNAQIRMHFTPGEVLLSAGGSDAGHAEESVPCEFIGTEEELLIAFNPAYLRDGLHVVRTQRVVFGFTESSRPAILIPEPEKLPELNDDGLYPSVFIRELSLRDFRSWPHCHVRLKPGITLFVGRNGHGKTNLVEAIGYVAHLGSHRVAQDAPLVRHGQPNARVSATAVRDDRELTAHLLINASGANQASINRTRLNSPRELLGVVRTVLFCPEDLALVRGEPAERRRYLDNIIATRRPRLAGVKADYEKVLRQRTTLLKTSSAALRRGYSGDDGSLATLDVWDAQLARQGAQMIAARRALVAELDPLVHEAYAGIAPESRPAHIAYESTVPDVGEDPALIEAAMLAELGRMRPKEIDRGRSLVGPHRDDLVITLGDVPAKGFASHGETWSMVLALRLGEFQLLRADGTDPVLILDDVFAELDALRRERLVHLTQDVEQVLITVAVPDDLPPDLGDIHRIPVVMTDHTSVISSNES